MVWWHPGTKFYEDLNIGDRFDTAGRTVMDSDIATFAGLTGDFHGLHMDDEFAKQSPYGERICQGLLSFSLLTGLFVVRAGIFEVTGLAFLGVDSLRFHKPVKVGDTIRAVLTVKAKRESQSKPDRGMVTFFLEGYNQRAECFLSCDWTNMLAKYVWKETLKG